MAVEELKKESNPDVIEEKARFIYEDYISILSPKEVSVYISVFLEILTYIVNCSSITADKSYIICLHFKVLTYYYPDYLHQLRIYWTTTILQFNGILSII